ncbi:MAG: hypothetical protein HRT71_18050 [Flavobacteriales bacterium]|nr:hypothetical protein [Flavobacteriales bacterium]
MKSRRLVKIFQGEMELTSSIQSKFKPSKSDTVLVGVLTIGKIEVSISTSYGQKVVANNIQTDNSKSLAPDNRIFYLNHPFNGMYITMVVRMPIREPHRIMGAAYLIVE